MKLQIGDVTLPNNIILAPMAGVTDAPFRRIVRIYHQGLVSGEMVSANALHYQSKRTQELIFVRAEEHPVSVQIFGSNPQIMAEAARVIEAQGADIIDINMGCPVPKVVKNNEGAALLRDLPLAAKIIAAVVAAVNIPVTVKCRLGWDEANFVALELAKIAADNGAKAITIHGRTRNQFYQGKADWQKIGIVKQQTSIPVIGNGDIDSPQAAKAILEQTNCDGIMIGQAAMGRPWIFKQVAAYLEEDQLLADPDLHEKFTVINHHLDWQIDYAGVERGVKEMRKHFAWYFKGLPGAAAFRDRINHLKTLAEVKDELASFAASLGVLGIFD